MNILAILQLFRSNTGRKLREAVAERIIAAAVGREPVRRDEHISDYIRDGIIRKVKQLIAAFSLNLKMLLNVTGASHSNLGGIRERGRMLILSRGSPTGSSVVAVAFSTQIDAPGGGSVEKKNLAVQNGKIIGDGEI